MQPDTSNLPGYWFCIKGDGEGACDEGGLIPEGKLTPLTQEDRAEALRREAEKVKELEAERLRAMAKQAAEAAIPRRRPRRGRRKSSQSALPRRRTKKSD